MRTSTGTADIELKHIPNLGAPTLAFSGGGPSAQDKAAKQAEIVKVAQSSLERFYRTKPELKPAVGKAPGYAVFTPYGFRLIFSGEGGKGLAHGNKSKKDTFMAMAGGSVGAKIGAS